MPHTVTCQNDPKLVKTSDETTLLIGFPLSQDTGKQLFNKQFYLFIFTRH